MIMKTTAFVASPTFSPAIAPKSGHIFKPVAQTAIGTLEPVALQDDELTSFFYPTLPLSKAPFTTSYDANLNTVILTGEDAYKSLVADKIQAQADQPNQSNQNSKSKSFIMADIKEATAYSKNAKLLDLTPALDEPVAFAAETQRFRPTTEKQKTLTRQNDLLKQQDESFKTLRQQNTVIEVSTEQEPISAKSVLSMSEARTLITEEQKALAPIKTLLPKIEADYWKSLLLASTPNIKGFNNPLDSSQCQTISFAVEAF